MSVGPSKDNIMKYFCLRLDEDETPDAMDKSLETDIPEKIPRKMSEMYVGAITPGIPPRTSANRCI